MVGRIESHGRCYDAHELRVEIDAILPGSGKNINKNNCLI